MERDAILELRQLVEHTPYTIVSRLGGSDERAYLVDDLWRLMDEAYVRGYQNGASVMAAAPETWQGSL